MDSKNDWRQKTEYVYVCASRLCALGCRFQEMNPSLCLSVSSCHQNLKKNERQGYVSREGNGREREKDRQMLGGREEMDVEWKESHGVIDGTKSDRTDSR